MDKVLCLVETNWTEDLQWWSDQEAWLDNEPHDRWSVMKSSIMKQKIIPLIDHPHSDKENGQKEIHYHVNSLYVDNYPLEFRISLPLKENQKLEYRYLKKVRNIEIFSTTVKLISKSKLKHKCIHKGKCPHRGFDLSNIKPDENGIITCPLHSLMFDTNNNNKIINFE